MSGKFITFEGGEGCGKTTQIKLFREWLESKGQLVVQTREPGGTGCPLAEQIRAILLNPENADMSHTTEFFLFMAARAQHVQQVIAPALEEGSIVLSDRFMDSTFAYQCYTRRIVADKEFVYCNNMALTYASDFYIPDITFILDVDVEVGVKRALDRNKRNGDQSEARFDNEDLHFHKAVNSGFRYLASLESNQGRIQVIDANESVENVQKQIREGFKLIYNV